MDPLTLTLSPLWRGEGKRGLHLLEADKFGLGLMVTSSVRPLLFLPRDYGRHDRTVRALLLRDCSNLQSGGSLLLVGKVR